MFNSVAVRSWLWWNAEVLMFTVAVVAAVIIVCLS